MKKLWYIRRIDDKRYFYLNTCIWTFIKKKAEKLDEDDVHRILRELRDLDYKVTFEAVNE